MSRMGDYVIALQEHEELSRLRRQPNESSSRYRNEPSARHDLDGGRIPTRTERSRILHHVIRSAGRSTRS